MAKPVDAGWHATVSRGGAGDTVLPEWITHRVSQMRGERVYCGDGKLRTIARVRDVNRTRGLLWYTVTTVEDEEQSREPGSAGSSEERSICEMDPGEPMADHARFVECEPDYLESYRDQTVRIFLCEPADPPSD